MEALVTNSRRMSLFASVKSYRNRSELARCGGLLWSEDRPGKRHECTHNAANAASACSVDSIGEADCGFDAIMPRLSQDRVPPTAQPSLASSCMVIYWSRQESESAA